MGLRAAPDDSGHDAGERESGIRSSDSGAFKTKPRVLVVDHDHSTARQLALALEVEGVDAQTVADGDHALAALEAGTDLVVIELMLPRRSGLELAREIRALYPDIRIVLTGAYHLSERQLTRAGCNAIAFIPKPSEPSVVASFVKEKALRTRR